MLIVNNIRITWQDKNLLFSARVPFGEVVFMGQPSGSGKSTFLHIIAGLLKPDEGSISWNDHDLLKQHDRPVAIQYQDLRLFPFLTLEENIRLGWSPDGRLVKTSESRMKELMHGLEINDLSAKPAGRLSGGERRRGAIVRALGKARRFSKPLLLLDEPLAGLDLKNQRKVCKVIQDEYMAHPATIIIASHQVFQWKGKPKRQPHTVTILQSRKS